MQRLVVRLTAIPFVRKALEETGELQLFGGRPAPRTLFGVSAILLSYAMCWPVIGLLSAEAVARKRPLLIIVGGPVAYGLSHLVFLLGLYLAGGRQSSILLRRLTRTVVLKLLARYPEAAPPAK